MCGDRTRARALLLARRDARTGRPARELAAAVDALASELENRAAGRCS